MKLFLCSHFSSVGSLIKEEIDNKKVAFIPTASLREGYTGYVGSARKLFKAPLLQMNGNCALIYCA